MSKYKYNPELKTYVDKKVSIKLNAGRQVLGVLIGYDQFMNITLDHALEHTSEGRTTLGSGRVIIRGNSIEMIEVIEEQGTTK